MTPNYFEQNQAEALDLNLTVLETLVRWADWAASCACVAVAGRQVGAAWEAGRWVWPDPKGAWLGGRVSWKLAPFEGRWGAEWGLSSTACHLVWLPEGPHLCHMILIVPVRVLCPCEGDLWPSI